MSHTTRSFALERIRITIEIWCEQVGDFLGSSFSSLKKPLTMLAALALVMTLRSARRGVQSMKSGGLTAGRYDATYKSRSGGSGSSSNGGTYTGARGGGATASTGSTMNRGVTSPGLKGAYASTSTTGSNGAYGSSSTTMNGAYGNSAYGSTTTTNGIGGGATATYGSGGATASTSTYGNNGATYGNNNNIGGTPIGNTAGTSMYGGQSAAPRPLADLLDRHSSLLRIMDAHLFHDYGGVHDFYGTVETLQAYEGSGVVEKVLQSPGHNKVLVVDGGANVNVGIFGKAAAAAAKQNGWKGVIIHGAIRDAKVVSETAGLGCKAMGTNPNRGRATTGSKGSALNIAGMHIATGMWVYADKDGIGFSDQELTTGGGGMAPMNNNNGMPGTQVGGGTQIGAYGSTATSGQAYGSQQVGAYGSQQQQPGQVGAYGSQQQQGAYGSQQQQQGAYGSTTTTNGAYGSTTGGSTNTYGGQQQQQQGAYSSTSGASASYGTASSTNYGAASRPAAASSTYGSTTATRSASASTYSHASARRSNAEQQSGISLAVYISFLSVLILPLELL